MPTPTQMNTLNRAGFLCETSCQVRNPEGEVIATGATQEQAWEAAWQWVLGGDPAEVKGQGGIRHGDIRLLLQHGYTVTQACESWWLSNPNGGVYSGPHGTFHNAWRHGCEKLLSVIEPTDRTKKIRALEAEGWKAKKKGDYYDMCKSGVWSVLSFKTFFGAWDWAVNHLPISGMSSPDLAKAMGFEMTKWLSREELAERKIYIMYYKETGQMYWSNMSLGIESSRGWVTEQEAVEAANEWLHKYQVINRSNLK